MTDGLDGFKKGKLYVVYGKPMPSKSAVLPNTCANYGFYCDEPDCDYITQNEDDHIVTDEGDYICLECAKKRELKND